MPLTIEEKIQQIKDKITALGWTVAGCSEDELEQLQQRQGVDYIPEMYQQIMRLMGREGMSRLLEGAANCTSLCEGRKVEAFRAALKYCRIGMTQDFFLIMEHAGYQFYFFRTKDRVDDPVVWGQWDDNWFYKLGDTLSTFILEEFEPDREQKDERWLERMRTAYFYNPDDDDFYIGPHPEPYD